MTFPNGELGPPGEKIYKDLVPVRGRILHTGVYKKFVQADYKYNGKPSVQEFSLPYHDAYYNKDEAENIVYLSEWLVGVRRLDILDPPKGEKDD